MPIIAKHGKEVRSSALVSSRPARAATRCIILRPRSEIINPNTIPTPSAISPTYGKALKITPVNGTGSGIVSKSTVALYSWSVSSTLSSANAPVSSTMLVRV